MFNAGEINNSGSEGMTVNSIDTLISTENLKASVLFKNHARTIIVTNHEGQQ